MRSERANSRAQRAKIRPESADFRPRWLMRGGMEGRKDGRMDGQKEGRLEIHPCPTGHRPFALWAVDWARWLLGYMGENLYLFDMAETM